MSVIAQETIPMLDLSDEVNELWNELNAAIQSVLRSGQFIMGPDVTAFEKEVASYLGVKHAIGVNSGTDALVIGLRALDIGAGDEVITTPFSFFATAEAISNVGAKPVFVDIEEDSFNIDPAKIEAAISPRSKAIMPVHLYGNPAAMTNIMAIAKKHNLKIIEDCAQSFGARYSGQCATCQGSCDSHLRQELTGQCTGTLGHIGAYSFFPTKNLGAYGDGGLITTNDDALAETCKMLRAHGSKKKYHNELIGYNSRLDSLQAAILRVKLPHIDTWNTQRRHAAQRYNELLSGVEGVVTPQLSGGHIFHQYTIRLTKANRDEVQKKLQEQGISTMVYYPIPQDQLPVYKGQYPLHPVSEELARQVISLPMWPTIKKEMQERVVESLTRALNGAS
jgi:dTDP-4-amino-4,6-dideoxygalactose transaminase